MALPSLPCRFTQAIGHYTALAWSNTNRVGCGLTEYREGKWFSKLYTCDYGPSGNYIGGQMYREGKACSACPEGTSCSSQFRGLCGEEADAISATMERAMSLGCKNVSS